jgi:hypothetical protein
MKKAFFSLLIIASLVSMTSVVSAKPVKSVNQAVSIEKATTYINSLKIIKGKLYGDFDYIQWFVGKDADREFLKDCKECKGYDGLRHAPNGYYIRNVNPKIRTFMISDQAEFVLQTRTGDIKWNEKVSKKDFVNFAQKKMKEGIFIPYHIEIRNGIVTKITEQYIP